MESEITQKSYMRQATIWIIAVCLSFAAILIGNKIVSKGLQLFDESGEEFKLAKVIEVTDREVEEIDYGEGAIYENVIITFVCKIEQSVYRDEVVAQQLIDEMYGGSEYIKEVEPGDKITVSRMESIADDSIPWQFNDYYRFNEIVILGIIFVILVLFMGRWKGLNTILSLVFTFSFVFFVFVPAVMNGYNAYITVVITSVYIIFMSSVLINGISRKTVAMITGCLTGTILASILTAIMSNIMHLTGFLDDESFYLTGLNKEKPMDLSAIVFAAIVIGAMGAIMDVSMDIATSLSEVSAHASDLTFGKLFKSGIAIGRDIMGTMSNTLILAYIGSSLSSVMLLLSYSTSAMNLINREVVIVELLQALIGSLAVMLTIPLTIVACCFLYIKKDGKQID